MFNYYCPRKKIIVVMYTCLSEKKFCHLKKIVVTPEKPNAAKSLAVNGAASLESLESPGSRASPASLESHGSRASHASPGSRASPASPGSPGSRASPESPYNIGSINLTLRSLIFLPCPLCVLLYAKQASLCLHLQRIIRPCRNH